MEPKGTQEPSRAPKAAHVEPLGQWRLEKTVEIRKTMICIYTPSDSLVIKACWRPGLGIVVLDIDMSQRFDTRLRGSAGSMF